MEYETIDDGGDKFYLVNEDTIVVSDSKKSARKAYSEYYDISPSDFLAAVEVTLSECGMYQCFSCKDILDLDNDKDSLETSHDGEVFCPDCAGHRFSHPSSKDFDAGDIPSHDIPARSEAFSAWVDDLHRTGAISTEYAFSMTL